MARPLRVLQIEDAPLDAELIVAELQQGGYDVYAERVETASAMREALARSPWDIVISDYSLPRFGGREALDTLKAAGLDLPFIIVSGTIGEETAIASLKAGAHDFLSKTRLARLLPAVERELRDVAVRREQILANDALRQSEAQYRSLVDRAVFGFCQSTADGRLITVNPALVRMLQYPSETDLLAANLHEFFVDADARERLLAGVLEKRRVVDLETMWYSRSGGEIRVRINASVVDADPDGPRALDWVVDDVTERHRLEEQWRQAQKMEAIGHLAGGIAHDFNNLLTTILGYSQLLTEQLGPDKLIGQDLQEIVNAAQRAAGLTRQLLAFSRRQAISLAPLDLNQTIAGLQPMLRRLIGPAITMITVPADSLSPVVADAIQLEQIIINLVVNARDAMPHGGTLTIETAGVALEAGQLAPGADAGAYAHLSVRDTGIGMTPEIQARIFEPFFTTKESGRGTGLGLAAVHGIVNQLKGWLTVDSEVGHGTVFHIYLPTTDRAVEATAATAGSAASAGTETILVVEDESAVRAFIKVVLARFGYRVLEAADAEAAIAILTRGEHRVALLLTDVILPKMNGRELARYVLCEQPEARVLFVSGNAERIAMSDGPLAPGLELLEKPFTAQALLARVRVLLAQDPRKVRNVV